MIWWRIKSLLIKKRVPLIPYPMKAIIPLRLKNSFSGELFEVLALKNNDSILRKKKKWTLDFENSSANSAGERSFTAVFKAIRIEAPKRKKIGNSAVSTMIKFI